MKTAKKPIFFASVTVYLLSLMTAIILLLTEPSGFQAAFMIIPLVVALFIGALGIGTKITSTAKSKPLFIISLIAVAILLTLVGFFVVAGAGWLIALSHAQ